MEVWAQYRLIEVGKSRLEALGDAEEAAIFGSREA
jgi:hypothetical protein